MTTSSTSYRKPDGSLSSSRRDAILISAAALEQLAAQVSQAIPPPLFSGIGRQETDLAVNEEDTDKNADGTIKAKTYGVYQLTKEEQIRTGIPGDLNDPEVATRVFAKLMESNLAQLAQLAGFSVTSVPADAWKYLAWSHNNGLGAVEKSIRTYGLDWSALKARPQNDYVRNKLIPYAEGATAGISAGWGPFVVGLLLAGLVGTLVWRYV